jgi:hypothetical protein
MVRRVIGTGISYVEAPDPPKRDPDAWRYLEYAEPPSFFCGLDLGQAADPSALCILEEPLWIPSQPEDLDITQLPLWPEGRFGWVYPSELLRVQVAYFRRLNWGGVRPADPPLAVRRLHRWGLRTPYHEIVRDVERLLELPPLSEHRTILALDVTGVGAGIQDMFDARGLSLTGVLITGGQQPEATWDEVTGAYHVPKGRLVLAARLLLEQRRLRLSEADPLTSVLVKELQDFKYKITAAANVVYSAREGQHDDILLALSMAAWLRSHMLRYVDAAMVQAERRKRSQLQEAHW